MNLRILLPFGVFAEKADVLRVVADTTDGSYGCLLYTSLSAWFMVGKGETNHAGTV